MDTARTPIKLEKVACVGRVHHVMMLLSTIDPVKADRDSLMFVDTGFPRLLMGCFMDE